MKICKIKGVDVGVHPSWFVAFAFLTWSMSKNYYPRIAPELMSMHHWMLGVGSTCLLFLSILLHEMGHTFVAIRYGVEVESITLHVFGGVAKYKHEISSPHREAIVSIAGPLVSLFLAAGFWFFNVPYVSHYLMDVNLTVAIFNMLPIFPMDGGRILRDILWFISGKYLKSSEKAVKIGLVCAKIFIVAGAADIITNYLGMGIFFLIVGTVLHLVGSHYASQVKNSGQLTGLVSKYIIPDANVVKMPDTFLVKDFYDYFLRYGFHAYPVVTKQEEIIGMVTYWHIKAANPDTSTPIKEFIYPILGNDVSTISSDTPVEEAYERMLFNNVTRLFVYDGDSFRGIITKSTILRILGEPIASS